jgi:hypothetical protein
MILLGQE